MTAKRSLMCALVALCALALALPLSARKVDDIPNVHVADSTRFVSDPDGYLSADAIRQADAIIQRTWQNTTAEFIVVFVKDLSGKDIDRYAIELTDKWKVGKKDKDNGVLLLVSMDDRQAGIYTGYGAEGVLPDIRAGRIRRDVLNPQLKVGNYDAALINTVNAIADVLNAPEAAEELRSGIRNNADADDFDSDEFWKFYISAGFIALVALLIWVLSVYFTTTKMERHARYARLQKINMAALIASFAFLGIPLIAWLLLYILKKHVRRSVPACPNCRHQMRLIDEVHDNEYLTPAQDKEEQLNSVDYDVWLCDNCGETEILPYINNSASYQECPNCGARAEHLIENKVIQQPTTRHTGTGRKTFACKNCGNHRQKTYTIEKLASGAIFLGGSGGGSGLGGGGGFGGGSFGGGSFGGGGSSGGW